MASSLNKVTLIGNVGRDPESRLTQEGNKVVTLSIATSEQWRDRKTEERKERVEWHRVVIFNDRLAEFVERFVKKGQRIYTEGQLQSRKWTDQQNQEHRVQEIVIRFKGDVLILDQKNDGAGRGDHGAQEGAPPMDMDMSDEIPF
jgi:single-strand DNA-binding protein